MFFDCLASNTAVFYNVRTDFLLPASMVFRILNLKLSPAIGLSDSEILPEIETAKSF